MIDGSNIYTTSDHEKEKKHFLLLKRYPECNKKVDSLVNIHEAIYNLFQLILVSRELVLKSLCLQPMPSEQVETLNNLLEKVSYD